MTQLFELQNEYDSIEKGYREINENQAKEFSQEIQFLAKQHQTLSKYNEQVEDISSSFKNHWESNNSNSK